MNPARSYQVAGTVALGMLLCAGIASGRQDPPPAPSPAQTIRVDVARVEVGVTVTDSRGRFVEGLQRNEFHIFDNGTEQPIAEFASVQEPGQVLLLLEAGPAVYFLQDAHLFAADELLNGLSTGDRVAIASYSDVPLPRLDFTADKRAAQAALDNVQFNLGFGQLNLSSSLNTVLDWLGHAPGKKTIVLLATGVDTSPDPAIVAVQARLQTGDVRILCVSLSGPLRNGKSGSHRQIQQTQTAFEEADMRLKALAEATGGHVYFPQNDKSFQGIYRQIAQLVRNEYNLSFAPPTQDGEVHTISVKVDIPLSATEKNQPPIDHVDHRKAYVAPTPVAE